MSHDAQHILATLDNCCESFTFPMLDNGYVYLAATRLSLFRSADDWAMVIEVFGFSPRSGIPDTQVYTLGSRLKRQRTQDDFVDEEAFSSYLRNSAHSESVFVYPLDDEDWIDADDSERVSAAAEIIRVRDTPLALAHWSTYEVAGIDLVEPPGVQVHELCRWLAAAARDAVLATAQERRACVPEELTEMLILDHWHHPDVASGERPSESPSFQMLAQVLSTGQASAYQPAEQPNTHWSNWPDGGSL